MHKLDKLIKQHKNRKHKEEEVNNKEADKLNKHENNKQSGEQGSQKEACLKVCLDTQVLKNPQHRC